MHKGIICGRGGQGIITVNRMLGEIASRMGYPVIAAETHGMAMRGGSVATYIKIGSFYSPSIGAGEADFMIATDVMEAHRNADGCAPEALCI
ncbi:MAG TPA: 2-oxoacid:acceptor oxidoreductase family protein, partial [Spirochaetota bacterium]